MPAKQLYERDFYQWTVRNAELLREGRLEEADVDHIAGEIEDMGKRDQREVAHRLEVLLMDLLKWPAQPLRETSSWLATINEQRSQLDKILVQSPSLRRYAADTLADAFCRARRRAALETRLSGSDFPEQCPYTLEQILELGFLPA